MTQKAKAIRCLFCDKIGAASREDIYPTWFATYVRSTGRTNPIVVERWTFENYRRVATTTSTTYGSAAALKLSEICRTRCNSGWMAKLEQRTKPILLPMMQGNHVTLSPVDQKRVAIWATLKAVTYDALLGSIIPASAGLHAFYAQRSRPLPGVTVHLGQYPEPQQGSVFFPHARHPLRLHDFGDNTVGMSVRFTFVFMRLLVQIAVPLPGFAHTIVLPQPPDDVLVETWPSEAGRDVDWPPIREITWETLAGLV